jgi:hypothetical protein
MQRRGYEVLFSGKAGEYLCVRPDQEVIQGTRDPDEPRHPKPKGSGK